MWRVLFANVTASVGGSEQVLISLAERLPSHGIEASFALFRPGPLADLLQSRGIRVHVFPYQYRFRNVRSVWRCIQWLAACIRTDEADLLHSNLTAHLIGAWSARMTKVPELWHLHDYPFKFDPAHAINRLIGANFYLFTTDYIKSGEPFLARRRHAVTLPGPGGGPASGGPTGGGFTPADEDLDLGLALERWLDHLRHLEAV